MIGEKETTDILASYATVNLLLVPLNRPDLEFDNLFEYCKVFLSLANFRLILNEILSFKFIFFFIT